MEFAQTAVWSIEMMMKGAIIIGVAGCIKNSGALSRKLSTTKCNIGAAAKAQFKNKESVRKLSSEKITAIAEERAAAIAKQRTLSSRSIKQKISDAEPKIINEAYTIFNSAEMGVIRSAHLENKSTSVTINGRYVQYEPGLPAGVSGFTMFGEEGFLIGKNAFSSKDELKKTILHELHRIHTSESANGVSAALAAKETMTAFDFAEKYYKYIK